MKLFHIIHSFIHSYKFIHIISIYHLPLLLSLLLIIPKQQHSSIYLSTTTYRYNRDALLQFDNPHAERAPRILVNLVQIPQLDGRADGLFVVSHAHDPVAPLELGHVGHRAVVGLEGVHTGKVSLYYVEKTIGR